MKLSILASVLVFAVVVLLFFPAVVCADNVRVCTENGCTIVSVNADAPKAVAPKATAAVTAVYFARPTPIRNLFAELKKLVPHPRNRTVVRVRMAR